MSFSRDITDRKTAVNRDITDGHTPVTREITDCRHVKVLCSKDIIDRRDMQIAVCKEYILSLRYGNFKAVSIQNDHQDMELSYGGDYN